MILSKFRKLSPLTYLIKNKSTARGFSSKRMEQIESSIDNMISNQLNYEAQGRTQFAEITEILEKSSFEGEEIELSVQKVIAASRLATENPEHHYSAYFMRILFNVVPGISVELAHRLLGNIILELGSYRSREVIGVLMMIQEISNYVKGQIS